MQAGASKVPLVHGLQSQQVGYRAMALTGFFSTVMTSISQRRPDLLRTWFEGRRRGRQGAYLMGEDWDELVEQPLDEVKKKLGFEEPPQYRPFDYPAAKSEPAQAT